MAAAAVAVVLLGAAGCGTGDAEAGAPASASPADTRPFTKDGMRAELDATVKDAGAPPMDPDVAELERRPARAGSLAACGVVYRGYGTDDEPLDPGRFDAMVDELRERGWRQAGERKERKDADGVVGEVLQVFKNRGWTLVAEFRGLPEPGYINLAAGEDTCVRERTAR
ncbi:hypothetical protein ACF065_23805 [Streptomyces sp. NPDC015232]|uniref:hypothetical protein n=1 Tax=unclassified Streptomyces TaxID=2593676 RepID=UPI0036FACB94